MTTAHLLDGRLILRQPRTGHRAGTDAVLLAASVPTDTGERIADVGAGVGTVGLALALRASQAFVHLIEKSPETADLASENARLNGVSERVGVQILDILDREARRPLAGTMSLVVSNPPFFQAGRTRASSDPRKARAHILDGDEQIAEGGSRRAIGHGEWLRATLALLAPHGAVVVIHRPDALPALMAASEGRLGNTTVRPVHAREHTPASRILFGGIAGSKAPFRLASPLILHGPGAEFSPLAEAIHRGRLEIPLFEAKKSRSRGPASSTSRG